MAIRLKVVVDELTWEEFETIQEAANGNTQFGSLRRLIARHMLDEKGEPLELNAALKAVGALRTGEIGEAVKALAEAIQVPPVSGGG